MRCLFLVIFLLPLVGAYFCQENKSGKSFSIDYDDFLNMHIFCDLTKRTATGATVTAIFEPRTYGLQVDRRIPGSEREDYVNDHIEVDGKDCL